MQLMALSEEEQSGTQSAQILSKPTYRPQLTEEEVALEENGQNIKELNDLNHQ